MGSPDGMGGAVKVLEAELLMLGWPADTRRILFLPSLDAAPMVLQVDEVLTGRDVRWSCGGAVMWEGQLYEPVPPDVEVDTWHISPDEFVGAARAIMHATGYAFTPEAQEDIRTLGRERTLRRAAELAGVTRDPGETDAQLLERSVRLLLARLKPDA